MLTGSHAVPRKSPGTSSCRGSIRAFGGPPALRRLLVPFVRVDSQDPENSAVHAEGLDKQGDVLLQGSSVTL